MNTKLIVIGNLLIITILIGVMVSKSVTYEYIEQGMDWNFPMDNTTTPSNIDNSTDDELKSTSILDKRIDYLQSKPICLFRNIRIILLEFMNIIVDRLKCLM